MSPQGFKPKDEGKSKKTPAKRESLQVQAKTLDRLALGSGSTTTLSSVTTQPSPYSGSPPSPWMKEALSHYLTSFQKSLLSTDPSPLSRGSSEKLIRGSKPKSPSISSTASTPFEPLEYDIMAQLKEKIPSFEEQTSKPKAIASARRSAPSGANSGPKCVSAKTSRPNSSRKLESTPSKPIGSLSTTKNSYMSTPQKSLSTMNSPRSERGMARGEQSDNKVDAVKLSKEVEEWRMFGGTMAESYEGLNKKFKAFMAEKDDTKATVVSLKEQVSALKSMLTKSQMENTKLKEASNRSSQLTLDSPTSSRKGSNLRESVEQLKEENQNIKKSLEFLKDENSVLKKSLTGVKKTQDEAEYYKNLAEYKFKECSKLAEEIICLRTDLDRCNSNLVRAQKAQKMQANNIGEEESPLLKLQGSSLKVKKEVSWKEELVEKSPKSKGGKQLMF